MCAQSSRQQCTRDQLPDMKGHLWRRFSSYGHKDRVTRQLYIAVKSMNHFLIFISFDHYNNPTMIPLYTDGKIEPKLVIQDEIITKSQQNHLFQIALISFSYTLSDLYGLVI